MSILWHRCCQVQVRKLISPLQRPLLNPGKIRDNITNSASFRGPCEYRLSPISLDSACVGVTIWKSKWDSPERPWRQRLSGFCIFCTVCLNVPTSSWPDLREIYSLFCGTVKVRAHHYRDNLESQRVSNSDREQRASITHQLPSIGHIHFVKINRIQ